MNLRKCIKQKSEMRRERKNMKPSISVNTIPWKIKCVRVSAHAGVILAQTAENWYKWKWWVDAGLCWSRFTYNHTWGDTRGLYVHVPPTLILGDQAWLWVWVGCYHTSMVCVCHFPPRDGEKAHSPVVLSRGLPSVWMSVSDSCISALTHKVRFLQLAQQGETYR